MIEHRCKHCGGELTLKEERYICRYCGSTYDPETAQKYTDSMRALFDDTKLERVNNLRRNLYDAVTATHISREDVRRAADELKQFLPDDPTAEFYRVATGHDVRLVNRAIRAVDPDAQYDEIGRMVEFLVKSLSSDEDYLLALNDLIERAYKGRDLALFERYATLLSEEATKVQEGVYETALPRDVFVAYSGKDMHHVFALVEELEEQGLSCFVAARNLRHGVGSVEDYDRALKEAMDNCHSVVFVSTLNSRNFNCDALRIELAYIKKQDIERAPGELRAQYDRIPHTYKKPRVEYRIQESGKNNAADKLVEDFFEGYERVYSPQAVAARVMQQLVEAPTSVPTPAPAPKPAAEAPRPAPQQAQTPPATSRPTPPPAQPARPSTPPPVARPATPAAPGADSAPEEEKRSAFPFIVGGVIVFAAILIFVILLGAGKDGGPDEGTTHDDPFVSYPTEQVPDPTDDQNHVDHYTFLLNEAGDGYKVTGYTGTGENLVIPAEFEGLPVTEIGDNAFLENDNIRSVVLPEGITRIGAYAFSGCFWIKDMVLPSTVTSIGEHAFYLSGLETISLPDGLQEIGAYAFASCHLASIDIPAGVTTIGEGAFWSLINLTSITLPDGLTEISPKMFHHCLTLTEVHIPAGVTAIGDGAFYECEALTDLKLPAGILTIGNDAYARCRSLVEVVIPDGVTSIGDMAFYGCEKLKKITLPASLTSIGAQCIDECPAFETVNYLGLRAQWDNITLGTSAFPWDMEYTITAPDVEGYTWDVEYELNETKDGYLVTGCYGNNEKEVYVAPTYNGLPVVGVAAGAFENKAAVLEKIVLPEGVTTIGSHAFAYCSNLREIVLPSTITTISREAVFECPNVAYTEQDGATYLGNPDNPYLVLVKAQDTEMLTYTIPDGTRIINHGAFNGCGDLTQIHFPEGLTQIGNSAFDGCRYLAVAKLPDSLVSLGDDAFSRCTSLKNVEIPMTLQTCGTNPFSGCPLESVTAPAMVFNEMYFSAQDTLVTAHVTSGTELKESVFEQHRLLESVTLPAGLTTIGTGAFQGCIKLTSLILPDSVTTIGESAFSNCQSLSVINIPVGVTKIEGATFYNCQKIETIDLPRGITKIGNMAFQNCYALTEITIPEKVVILGDEAFAYCHALTRVVVPNSVTTVGKGVFCGSPIEYATLPGILAAQARGDNTALREVVIGDGTEIPASAFAGCENLAAVTLPGTIETIGATAFDGCTSLTSMAFNGSTEQWNALEKGTDWNRGMGALTIYCLDGEVTVPAYGSDGSGEGAATV